MDYTFISDRITSLLEYHNMTEYELSLQIGRCKNYINKITSGKSHPSLKGLGEICDYFDITTAEFFDPQSPKEITAIRQINKHLKHLNDQDLQLVITFVERLDTPGTSVERRRT